MNGKFHCDFSSVLESVWKKSFIFLFLLGKQLISYVSEGRTVSKEDKIISLVILAIFISIAVYSILVWRKTWISIDDNLIIIERNTMNKRVNTIAIANVSNINLEQNLFERMIGTSRIKIDTNSISTADSTDVEIILKKEQAEEFKSKISSIKDGKPTELENVDIEEYDVKFSLSDTVKHSLYSLKIWQVILFIPSLVLAFNIEKENYSLINLKLDKEGVIAIFIIVIPIIFSTIKRFLKYYNFKAIRKNNEICLSYGYFTKVKYDIPIEKINAVIINKSLLSRLFKRVNVEIVNIGMGDEETEGSQLLLYCTEERCKEYLNILLPEYNFDYDLQRQSSKVFVIKTIYLCLWLIFAVFIGYNTTMIVSVVLISFMILYTILSYFTKGVYLGEDYIYISAGVFGQRISIISYDDIQYMKINTGIISKSLDIAKGEIFILATMFTANQEIGYYNEDVISNIIKKI